MCLSFLVGLGSEGALRGACQVVEHALDCFVGFHVGVVGELVQFGESRIVGVILVVAVDAVEYFASFVAETQ